MNPPSILAACNDAEKAAILATLVGDDPALRRSAEELARRHLAVVDVASVVEALAEELLRLDTEDLANRAGPRRHGYVEPTEAAWHLLEETLAPWIEDLRRRGRVGLHGAAADLGDALLQALVRAEEGADQAGDCLLREWAPDFPAEAARQVQHELDSAAAAGHAEASSDTAAARASAEGRDDACATEDR